MATTRLLIADDSPAIRAAVDAVVARDPSIELVASAENVDEAIRLAERHQPDIALLDVRMPNGGGLRALKEIATVSPQTRVLALSAYGDKATVLDLILSGAAGYIVKGTSAERMLEAIRRCAAGESVLSTSVTADVVTELRERVVEARQLAASLASLDDTKRELIQMLAHELRTPVTVIKGAVSTIAKRASPDDGENLKPLIAAVWRATTRISRLAANVSAVAALEGDREQRGMKIVPLADILIGAAANFDEDRLSLPRRSAIEQSVWAEPDMAVQAVAIVIENALDLSDDVIEVDVRSDYGIAEIRIRDRGPGIPPEKGDAIFDLFTQVDSSSTPTHEGLGIGLYLARRIMTAMGGSIEFCPRPGGGSTFVTTFRSL